MLGSGSRIDEIAEESRSTVRGHVGEMKGSRSGRLS